MAKIHNSSGTAKEKAHTGQGGRVCRPLFRLDLRSRRAIHIELPEFLIFALEQRVTEANADAPESEAVSLDEYVESELANLITLRDVAELETVSPGFTEAVQAWLKEMEG